MMQAQEWEMAQAALVEQFEADTPFDRGTLQVGERTLKVLVARTEDQRARGMIGRRFAGFDAMVFDLGETRPAKFTNQGVSVPILIAFYAEDGTCLRVQAMDPGTVEVDSQVPCRYVVEFPFGDPALMGELVANEPLAERVDFSTLQADALKKTPEDVNLRAADPTTTDSCPNCSFFIGTGVCELVATGAATGMVCDEYTPMKDVPAGPYPTMNWPVTVEPTRTP